VRIFCEVTNTQGIDDLDTKCEHECMKNMCIVYIYKKNCSSGNGGMSCMSFYLIIFICKRFFNNRLSCGCAKAVPYQQIEH
jgi:hypothetical protein